MNLGIIGAGMIVKDFLSFAHELPEIKLEAIVARNLENLKRLSDEYEIKNIYTNIEECLANTAIDTIYVAVPNNLHYSVAKKSLEAGKNVICEKPFTLNYEEAEELFSLADSKSLILIEAITNQYQENYKEIKSNISKIGNIRRIAVFQRNWNSGGICRGSIDSGHGKGWTRGGGVLGDLNIYNIHFVVGIFGEPQSLAYYPNIVRGVDTSGVLILEYKDFKAVCVAAKDTFNNSYVNIQGDEGIIKVDGPSSEVSNYKILSEDGLIEGNKNIQIHRMFSEFKKFIDVIDNKDFDFYIRQKNHSLAVMKILDEARKVL